MNFTSSSSSSRTLGTFLLLQLLLVQPCLLHPQPCHLLAQIGHSVRVGALLPAQRAARVQVQAALSRAAAALSRDNFLPYNLSLELVPRQPAAADPESLFRCLCQGVVVQGVTAVLAFPQSREELLQVDFMASFLEIPFISVIEHEEPLDTQVGAFTGHVPGAARALRGNMWLRSSPVCRGLSWSVPVCVGLWQVCGFCDPV
eukprot:superscaffoldBa00014956_g26488